MTVDGHARRRPRRGPTSRPRWSPRRAIGAIAGKSTIIADVIDALTDQPVAGAPVTADLSTSPTQTRSTGADGKVVFAGLEPSAIALSDPKYKYRLTVGLTDPWVTHPDTVPAQAQQHLTASQTSRPR